MHGPSAAAPSAVGTYAAFATVTDATYSGSGSATATLTIVNPAPTVSAVTPPSGPDWGGTAITITGTGFMSGATVEIGGVSVTATYVSSTTITAVTPPGTGVATVVVHNPAPNLGEGAGTFLYLSYPLITAITPSWGPAGTVVTITGRNFSATDVAVTFGTQAGEVTSRSATQIVVTVPAGLAAGPVDVTVTNTGSGRSRMFARLFTVAASQPAGAGGVAAGDGFTCVVTATGGVQCWGRNDSGQLGDGTSISRGTGADVTGLTSAVTAVAAGEAHACALTASGGVKCWGANQYGQLGDGTWNSRSTPGDVSGLTNGVVGIAAGANHTCAVTSGGGGVKCWGANYNGQLGDGTTTSKLTPVDVTGLTNGIVAVSAGSYHSCAVTTGGGVKCWGNNDYGELGDGTTNWSATPVDASGLAGGVSAVTAGSYHTCALTISGGVKCWGYNWYGELGDGTTNTRTTPVDVSGLTSGISAVSAGSYHTCAVTAGGGVKCWGDNSSGQLGDGAITQRTTAVDVSGLAHAVSAVAAGYDYTCVLETDGGVQCWGSDVYGQLGTGGNLMVLTPAEVPALASGVSALAAGYSHNCVVTASGGVKCWGYNFYGQLGDGTVNTRATPAAVSGLAGGVAKLGLGYYHSCAVTTTGGVKCWGTNGNGELGNGTTMGRSIPVDVTGLTSGVVAIAAGGYHTCALTSSGGVKCWGYNYYGQLGDGTTTDRETPVDVGGLTSGVIAVAAGYFHTCAVTSSGGVKCWGWNSYAQLGDGTTTQRTTPVDVSGLTAGVVGLAAGGSHTCVLTSAGGVKCWGNNYYGQLGDGTTTDRSVPVDVTGLTSGVVGLVAGAYHTCAVTSGGAVKCWGSNGNGQLGDGTTTTRWTPVDVSALTSGVIAVAAGNAHTCALTAAGGVKCWGDNTSRQLGDGQPLFRSSPANAAGFGVTVSFGNLEQAYDGTPKPITVTTTPAGLAVTVTYTGIPGTTYGPSQTAPSAVGTYAAFATVTDPGYTGSGSATATLTIANPAPTITMVSPSSGPDTGGTPITVTGTGFMSGATVEIAGLSAAGTYVNSTTMTAVTPAVVGDLIATVIVRNPAPNLGEGTGTFTYLAYPRIVSIAPTWGPIGTVVTITGVNFSASDAAITFGTQTAAVTSRSATEIVVTVPAGLSAGPVDVTVTNVALGRSRTYARLFTVGAEQPAGAGSVAAGNQFTCVVTANGGVQCWGNNGYGQLGDGTSVSRGTPADVSGLTGGVTVVTAGSSHACALTLNGGVKCWGDNGWGQLGDGTYSQRPTPVDVSGLTSGVVAVAAGYSHTCALTSGGGVKCWGNNGNGQLGDGTTTQRTTPVDVSGLTSGVLAVAAGSYHTCALTSAGGVKCWGRNDYGQLGDGTTTQRTAPVDVSGLTSGVVAVAAASYHTCALTSGGGVKCWGANWWGQLGDGTTTQRTTPIDVSGLTSGATTVAAGYYHTCSAMSGGGAKCWGGNFTGQLGDGTTNQRNTPTVVAGLAHAVSAVAAGYDHTCVLATDGGVQCWGSDAYGQLGIGGRLTVLTPADVPLANGLTALASGYSHSCVITASGGVKCWGANSSGQLGDGTTTTRATLAAVSGLAGGVTGAALGYYHSCALTVSGGVKCWGSNGNGQLGDGTYGQRLTPIDVSGLTSGVAAVAAGYYHTCALTSGGGVKCWGNNGNGQLGDGTTNGRNTPVDVSGLAGGVTAIAAGGWHTCALTSGGGVKCWGSNSYGQLGDGTTTQRTTPVDVSGLTSGVIAVAAGGDQTCAITGSGGVKCWGLGGWGELGDGTSTDRWTAVDVSGLTSGVVGIAAGNFHTCALTSVGGLKCWGQNSYGQIGDGTTSGRNTPADVSGLAGGVAAIGAGGSHTCALTTGGGVKCWGDNSSGQLGDGRTLVRLWPSNASGFGATVTLTNLNQTYDGTPKPVTVATTPSGLAVTVTYAGIGGTTYGPTQSAPSGLGTYAAFATVTDPGYTGSGSATATLTIANPAPTVTSVTPPSGPDTGGTPITITGTGFMAGATVEIFGLSAAGTYVNSTTMTAITPSVVGDVIATVIVRNPAPSLGEGTATFTYLAYPRIVSIAPTWGPIGTVVTITGVNFSASDAAITFGTQPATVTSRSATQLVATVPSGLAAGPVDVTVTNVALGRSRTYAHLFTVGAEQPVGAGGVAAGNQFTCVVTASGGVQCWGNNGYGQAGRRDLRQPRDASGCHWAQRRRDGSHGGRFSRLRADAEWRRQVLGLQHQRATRRWHDDATHDPGRCERPDEWCDCRRGRELPHVRADERRRREVLGLQLQRTTWRRHDDATHDTGRCERPNERRSRRDSGEFPHVRADERRWGEVLGQQRQRSTW